MRRRPLHICISHAAGCIAVELAAARGRRAGSRWSPSKVTEAAIRQLEARAAGGTRTAGLSIRRLCKRQRAPRDAVVPLGAPDDHVAGVHATIGHKGAVHDVQGPEARPGDTAALVGLAPFKARFGEDAFALRRRYAAAAPFELVGRGGIIRLKGGVADDHF